MQSTGSLSGFAHHIAPAKAGQFVDRVMQPKLVHGAVRAQQLQLRVLQLGVHLLNRVAGIYTHLLHS